MIPNRILCIRNDRLGETVLTLPAVSALHRAYPKAEITLMVRPELAGLLDGLPDAAEVWADDAPSGGFWWQRARRLAAKIRSGRFDLAVVFNAKKDLHLAVRLAGIPRRAGYARKWGWCLTIRVPDRKHAGDRHEVDCNLDLVRALGEPVFAPAWRLPGYHREREEIRRRLAGASRPLVAVHPWTSNPVKQWPVAKFRELIGRLSAHADVAVVGGPEFRPRAAEAVPPEASGILDFTGRTSLRELAALLQESAVLVSNDSGPVHLAAALGTKTVVLFGGTDPATGPARWGPWGLGHTVLRAPSLGDISVEEVLAASQPRAHVRV